MICNICEKESVCKLIDGSDVVKCVEFLSINPNDYTKNAGMTNEEAIKRMKWTKGRTGITSEEAEAIGYAIEKLSNSDEDCISRKAALDLARSLTRWCVRTEDGKFNNVGMLYDDVMFGIAKLPSVTPQPKTDVLNKIRAVAIKWETDTWTDNLSYECMCEIADILAESEG